MWFQITFSYRIAITKKHITIHYSYKPLNNLVPNNPLFSFLFFSSFGSKQKAKAKYNLMKHNPPRSPNKIKNYPLKSSFNRQRRNALFMPEEILRVNFSFHFDQLVEIIFEVLNPPTTSFNEASACIFVGP